MVGLDLGSAEDMVAGRGQIPIEFTKLLVGMGVERERGIVTTLSSCREGAAIGCDGEGGGGTGMGTVRS